MKRFVARILWEGLVLGEGEGKSKKEAEVAAARDALQRQAWQQSSRANGAVAAAGLRA
jgi:ribonuclease-3